MRFVAPPREGARVIDAGRAYVQVLRHPIVMLVRRQAVDRSLTTP